MELHKLIRERMTQFGFSVNDIAYMLHMKPITIYKWIEGSRKPRGENRDRLFKFLAIKEEDLKDD